jgi:cell wall-associated NlpC family hydrolase
MAAATMAPLVLAVALVTSAAFAKQPRGAGVATPDSSAGLSAEAEAAVRASIERHLHRPYVWGASGLKSFDCSGFVWRLMSENGILIKRTTARKFYMCLPRVAERDRWKFGNVVFFNNLKHCGIVDTPETFYHAAVSVGTHESHFDPEWRGRICGVRALPRIEKPAVAKE